jgi:hypothetical protein
MKEFYCKRPDRQEQSESGADDGHRGKLSGLERSDTNEGTPPNALIDHWPAACNRLDSLPLGLDKEC